MAPSQYSPLNEDAKEVRILTLLSEESSPDLRMQIDTASLTAENPPVFEALSYTWGSTTLSVNIRVGPSGDDCIAATPNLSIALPYLRYKDRPRTPWVDAICVDQQSLKERGQQVERMCDIYKLAQRVVVWLGPEANNST
jgi:hypothetical protein